MATGVMRPIIVIVGPTASGKTALAVEIARLHDGEIICADSRTIFRDMNIGTAKPPPGERGGVPHWGIDLVAPGERFTAADFQVYASRKIDDIRARGKVPIVVGGTGLYVDGLVFEYQFPLEVDADVRQQFEAMSLKELITYCDTHNIKFPENRSNKRHVIGAILRNAAPPQRSDHPKAGVHMYGIAVNKTTLQTRIRDRTEHMFADGVVEEAKMLGEKYSWDSEAMTGNIYPLMREYFTGTVSLDEAKHAFLHRDWQLAKRQMTWFRRNPYLAWGTAADIKYRVNDVLASGHIL